MAAGEPARLSLAAIVTAAPTALADLLAHVPLGGLAHARLAQRMAEPHRRYHGVAHLASLWARHCALGAASGMRVAELEPWIACAIAYHDAIYEPARTDNEAQSAALWRTEATAAALPPAQTAWVAETIAVTADHLGYQPRAADAWERARMWVLDLDLSPLGEPLEQFDHMTRLLRAEYAHMDEQNWRRSRVAFLGRLAASPQLYRTPMIAAVYGESARQNIGRSLARLRAG